MDLQAYNISITSQDATTFFGTQPLSGGIIDLGLLTIEHPLPEPRSNWNADEKFKYKFTRDLALLMKYVIHPTETFKSAVVQFAAGLLNAAEYDYPPRLSVTRPEFKLSISGRKRKVVPDIAILDCQQNDIVILVLDEHKSGIAASTAKARLISKAVAAYQNNTDLRKEHNLPPPKNQVSTPNPIPYKTDIMNSLCLVF